MSNRPRSQTGPPMTLAISDAPMPQPSFRAPWSRQSTRAGPCRPGQPCWRGSRWGLWGNARMPLNFGAASSASGPMNYWGADKAAAECQDTPISQAPRWSGAQTLICLVRHASRDVDSRIEPVKMALDDRERARRLPARLKSFAGWALARLWRAWKSD
jgi:hypothetical protein